MANLQPAPGFVKHPDHKMDITPAGKGYEVSYQGKLIARSSSAMLLEEGNYQGRLYFPRLDVSEEYLTANSLSTYCPFKGDARYWNVKAGTESVENGAWAYDTPFDESRAIEAHVCFYTEKDGFSVTEFVDVA
ncbi:MAG: DUF427 domain-containing protein [Sneathiella sp.]